MSITHFDWFSLRLNNCNNAANAKPPMCNKLQLNKLTTCEIIEVPKNEHMQPRKPNSLEAWLNFYINIDVFKCNRLTQVPTSTIILNFPEHLKIIINSSITQHKVVYVDHCTILASPLLPYTD